MAADNMVARWRFEVDLDPARPDREWIVRTLGEHAYWGRWRTRTQVESQVESAWRLAGAYRLPDGAMIGFARAVSDGVSIAYLADVIVDPAHRGNGVGSAVVAALVDSTDSRQLRWLLHTQDGHPFYRRFGFGHPDPTVMQRGPDLSAGTGSS